MNEDEVLEFNYKNPNPTIHAKWENTYRTYPVSRSVFSGFPSDDALALQQKADGDWMEEYYGSMFYQNEIMHAVAFGGKKQVFGPSEHTPIMKGTLTGYVNYNGDAVQTFVFNTAGVCTLTKIGTPWRYVENMSINWQTGQITATTNVAVNLEDIKLIISYECER